jgi:aminoglycoside phosphotransferase (APT) family kinase protein
LHRRTARAAVVDDDLLAQWIAEPLSGAGCALRPQRTAALERLAGEVMEALRGRRCQVAWTHGDYWCGNVLMDGVGEHVTGIVDWGGAAPDGLPVVDVQNLVLTTRAIVGRTGLGSVVVAAVEGVDRTAAEREVLAAAGWCWPNGAVDERAVILLTWLGHVTSVLRKRPAYATDERWLASTVDPVLELG